MYFIHDNLDEFARVFARYEVAYHRGFQEALEHQTGRFARELRFQLIATKPPKGQITARNLARMKSTKRGLRIHWESKVNQDFDIKGLMEMRGQQMLLYAQENREGRKDLLSKGQRVRAKKLFAQMKALRSHLGNNKAAARAMVAEAELKNREKAVGFVAASADYPSVITADTVNKGSRGVSSKVTRKRNGMLQSDNFEFEWGDGVSRTSILAARALNTNKGRQLVARTLATRIHDMREYIAGRHGKAARAAARTIA